MLTKEIKCTATLAWAPASSQSTRLVTGTLAGAMDASFSTSAELEIHEVNLADRESTSPAKLCSVSSNSRFNRLAWSAAGSSTSNDGVIIGGMEDGSVGFWNASKLINGQGESSLIELKNAHQGPVRGLQVNPQTPNLVASGSINGDLLLWDLQSLQSYPPTGQRSARLEDVSDVAWNCQVSHILAAGSTSGYAVVWDLKSRKEVIQMCLPGGRKSVSAIAWNPDTPTHLLTATDDDQSPVIYSWDLRNSHAPSQTFTGHTKGVLALSWCPKDSELLLSSGKDNRVLCWNPKEGSLVSEVSQSSNWIFDTQWCPRNPDIFASASFDGRVTINSFQALSSGHVAPAPVSSAATDLFGSPAPLSQAPAAGAQAGAGPRQIPKWLRRPIGASFGFGGRLLSFGEVSGRRVTICAVASQDRAPYTQDSLKLDEALRQGTIGAFSAAKAGTPPPNNLHGARQPDAIFWSVVKVLVEGQQQPAEQQRSLLNLLGFDHAQFQAQVKALGLKGLEESLQDLGLGADEVVEGSNGASALSSPAAGLPVDFGSGDSSVFDELAAKKDDTQQKEVTPHHASAPFELFGKEASPTDRAITRAIILGDFKAAVDICIQSGRLSDALLVAICGGPELVASTQEIYLQRVRYPYLRVVSAIIKQDLTDVVTNADVANWEELLGLICSFASNPADFSRHCAVLAERLEQSHVAQLALPSVLCWMAAGRAVEAAKALLRLDKAPSRFSHSAYAAWLEGLVEKLRGLERASAAVPSATHTDLPSQVPEVAARFREYAVLMAEQGALDIAARYYVPPSEGAEVPESEVIFADRLFEATRAIAPSMAKVPAPFSPVSVQPEGQAQQPAQQMPAAQIQPTQANAYAQPGQWAPPAPTAAPSFTPQMPVAAPQQPTTGSFGWNPPAAPAPAPAPAPPAPFGAPPAPSPFAAAPPAPAPYSSAPPAPFAAAPPAPFGAAPQMTSPTGMTGLPGQNFTAAPMAPPQPAFGAPQQPAFGAPQLPRAPSFGTAASPTAPGPMAPVPAPFIPAPAPVVSPIALAPSLEQIRKAPGGFNDAPIIAPRQPTAAPAAPMMAPPTFVPAAPQQPSMMPMTAPSVVQPPPAASVAPAAPAPISPKALGPVDPSRIPAASRPIYDALSSLTAFCQARAMPVQRRVLDDSMKRLQFLYHQLAGDAQPSPLSPHVHSELLRLAQLLSQRQWDQAIELHVPLMTAHFHEVGQWILAIKRLVEVAKTCPPQ